MVLPAADPVRVRNDFGGYKPVDEFIHGVPIRDDSRFQIVKIKRDSNIARVAHDINHSGIAWIETLMAFQDARQSPEQAVRQIVDDWYQPFHVGEGDGFVLLDEVAEQEAGPRAAGPEVADQEDVIGKYG